MIKNFTKKYSLFLLLFLGNTCFAQNSVLVNFGSAACGDGVPFFSMIKDPLSVSPQYIAGCDFSQQAPNYSSIFIAYNPRNNKLYIADNRTGLLTNIWLLDIGLPLDISCPASIPASSTYSYSYISNNFEFDNNGDLWSLSDYDINTGRCNIDNFDVNTGTVINTRLLQFPVGNFPTTVASGDITILPNGRMFAVLGSGTCRLYEITNYNGTTPATATYLQTLPKDCYGIAYLNGILETTGTDGFSSCYYYDYNIATGVLGTEKTFQNGQVPIDNTSFTPSVGCTKKLLSATKINDNTADLVYEIYSQNQGNVILNNISLSDDLGAVFGDGNISNVSVNFVAGSNAAGLMLNSSYNGTTVTDILVAGQNLPNKISTNRDYFFKVQVHFRVTNLVPSITYLNSAVTRGNIGGSHVISLVNVSDSSNNGDSTVTDPNKNGNAGDAGENVPTPFSLTVLPVKFVQANVSLVNKNSALVKWQVATPTVNAVKFDIEYSLDGKNWQNAGTVMISNSSQGDYSFTHLNIPAGNIFYRIKQKDNDGTFTYSKIMLLHNNNNVAGYIIFPNPANDNIIISSNLGTGGKTEIALFDAAGRKLMTKIMTGSSENINTTAYPVGTYLLKLFNGETVHTYKLVIQH